MKINREVIMEFYEKLQELRKDKGLTQEELAESLYVSRTAISKWESGRGYPSIDSLKEISKYFDISIDELLSTEKLLTIAEREKKESIQSVCDMLFGIVDVLSFILIVLPLYPNTVNGIIYSVNLLDYTQGSQFNRLIYGGMYILLMLVGIVKLVVTKVNSRRYNQLVTGISMVLSILLVLLLALTREVYALIVVFLFVVIKGMLIIKGIKR